MTSPTRSLSAFGTTWHERRARVDTLWWHELAPPLVCFIRGRLVFDQHTQAAPFPSVAAYFGPHPDRFRDAFRPLGMLYEVL